MLMSLKGPRGGHRRKNVMNHNICYFVSTNFVQIQFFSIGVYFKNTTETRNTINASSNNHEILKFEIRNNLKASPFAAKIHESTKSLKHFL